jgi:large subunit ribosomal protein L5
MIQITGQQASIVYAAEAIGKWKARKGMPVGVEVRMTDPHVYFSFLDRLVEVVMPKLRDFQGFSTCAGSDDGRGQLLRLPFDAETWEAFPELQQQYLKFPQLGSVGALQPFEVRFRTTARDDDEARLLLSGFRVPFTKQEQYTGKFEEELRSPSQEEEDVQDV